MARGKANALGLIIRVVKEDSSQLAAGGLKAQGGMREKLRMKNVIGDVEASRDSPFQTCCGPILSLWALVGARRKVCTLKASFEERKRYA
jgi:hypothetical protein